RRPLGDGLFELVEADLLALGSSRIERDGTGDERQTQEAFPVDSRGHYANSTKTGRSGSRRTGRPNSDIAGALPANFSQSAAPHQMNPWSSRPPDFTLREKNKNNGAVSANPEASARALTLPSCVLRRSRKVGIADRLPAGTLEFGHNLGGAERRQLFRIAVAAGAAAEVVLCRRVHVDFDHAARQLRQQTKQTIRRELAGPCQSEDRIRRKEPRVVD